jgi:hypothetical protein
MNVRDRFLAALRGQQVDRVPLHLDGFDLPAGQNVEQVADPLLRRLIRRIVPHNIAFYWGRPFDNRYLMTPRKNYRVRSETTDAEGTTTVVEIPTPKGPLTAATRKDCLTNTIWTVKYPVEDLADLDKLASVPWEMPEDVGPPELDKAPADLHSRRLVRTRISSPFVCVAGAMSYEYFLELCATELALIRELTAVCLERSLQVLEPQLAAGTIEYVWMGGCEWLTPPMGSPRLYEELVQGPEAPIIDLCHRHGALVHMHCHGRVRSTLEKAIARGVDYFEPVEPPPDGDITMAEAKALAAGRITLGGNVEARVLELGSRSEVEAAVRAAFEGGTHRMVLRHSVEPIGTITPVMAANYERMLDLYEEWGGRVCGGRSGLGG